MYTKYKILNTTYIAAAAAVCFCVSLVPVAADALSISPVIIDRKAKARDVIEEQVVLLNDASVKMEYYASVEDVLAQEGARGYGGPGGADTSQSLASWMEFTRGQLEFASGEARTLPLRINVDMHAKPGTYHAKIVFRTGATRAAADTAPPEGEIVVNLEVEENAVEQMQIKSFAPSRTFFMSFNAAFSSVIENIGNKVQSPSGEIRIYDRGGREVSAVPVNKEGRAVAPSTTLQLASLWEGAKASGTLGIFSTGRYKALLNLNYGKDGRERLQDSVYFWVIPWYVLMALMTLLAGLGTYTYRRIRWHGRTALLPIAAAETETVPVAEQVPQVAKPRNEGFTIPVTDEAVPISLPKILHEPIAEIMKARELVPADVAPMQHVHAVESAAPREEEESMYDPYVHRRPFHKSNHLVDLRKGPAQRRNSISK